MDFFASLLADYSRPPLFIAAVIGVPSLVLYIAEVLTLLKHGKRFNSAFYHLFLTRALISIVNYVNSYVNIRFARLGLFYSLYADAGSVPIAFNWFLS